MDSTDAKRSKPLLTWDRVQDIYIKIAPTLDNRIHRVYSFFGAPLEVLIASGAYLTFSDAIRARILRGQRPGYEIGIDGIILYTMAGCVTYAFLQAKHYANAIDCNAIATFMAAITLAKEATEVDTSLLCITGSVTDFVQRLARPYNFKIVSMSEHQLLAKEAEVDGTQLSQQSTKASIHDLEPRDYQLATVDTVMKAYTDCVPTCIVGHPPGCGKTFIMMLSALQFFGGLGISNIVVACPGRSSALQAFALFKEFMGANAEVILVSMDGTMKVTFDDLDDKVKPRLYVTTFRSFDVVVNAMTQDMYHDNSVVFVDESHYPCVEDMVAPIIDMDILVVLVSGTSAYIAPYLQCNDEYRSTILLKDAEDQGLVVPQIHYFPSYLDDTPFADIEKPSAMPEAYAKFAAAVFARSGANRPLVYWNTVEGARIVLKAIEEELTKLSFTTKFELVIGDVAGPKREEIFSWVADGPDSEYRGIVAVQALNDSLNVPRINGIAIPSIGNVATAIQRIFRGNRIYPNKESCTVAFWTAPEDVVTLFPDTYVNCAQRVHCVSDNLFENTTERDTIATTSARTSTAKIVDDYVNGVSLLNWNPSCWLPLLKDFIDLHGFKKLNTKTEYKGRVLGQWYKKQVTKLRAGHLSEGEVQTMKDAGVIFDDIPVKKQARAPVEFDDKLRVYKEAMVVGITIKRETEFNGHPVGQWTKTWRGHKDSLTPDQIASLDAINFAWNAQEATFDAQIQAYRFAIASGGVKCGTNEYNFKRSVRGALKGATWANAKVTRRRYMLLLDVEIIAEDEFPVPDA